MLISLARDRGYRWRDMAVLAGNLQEYSDLITTVFQIMKSFSWIRNARPPFIRWWNLSVQLWSYYADGVTTLFFAV